MEIASTVKMVQNVLIGPVAIAVTIYWIAYVLPTVCVDGNAPTWLAKMIGMHTPTLYSLDQCHFFSAAANRYVL